MPPVKPRLKTTLAERLVGLGLALVAISAAVYLMAPRSLRREWDEKGLPLRSLDEQWRDIGFESVPMASLLRQPLRDGRPIPYRSVGGALKFLRVPEGGGDAVDPIVCAGGRAFAPQVHGPSGDWAPSEWDGSAWRSLHPPPPGGEGRPLLREVACLPDGGVLLIVQGAFLDRDGKVVARWPPGNLFTTAQGFYRLVQTKTGFPLWFAKQAEGPWLPIGGGRNIAGIATSKDGVIAWGGNVGRLVDSTPTWREWPAGFVPTSVGALSTGGFIGWNDARMYVARTFDAPIAEMPLPGRIREFVEGVEAPGVLWFMEGNHARRFALR